MPAKENAPLSTPDNESGGESAYPTAVQPEAVYANLGRQLLTYESSDTRAIVDRLFADADGRSHTVMGEILNTIRDPNRSH